MGFMLSKDIHRPPSLRSVDMWLIFVVAMVVRVFLLKEVVAQIGLESLWTLVPDGVHFVDLAWDLVQGTHHASRYLSAWPPGYSVFLAPLLAGFGKMSMFPILLQVLLSSLSAVLLYGFVYLLTGRRLTAFLSGCLFSLSSTSISLSVLILSDTLFVFLLLAGLVYFTRALQTGRWKHFVLSGMLSGSAILVRAVGEFWPVVMLVIALCFAYSMTAANSHAIHATRKSILIKALVCVGIVVAIEGSWMSRNYLVNGIPYLTTAGSGGLANVTAFRYERAGGESYRKVRNSWQEEYKKENSLASLTPTEAYRADLLAAQKVLREYPGQVLEAYLALVWENLNAVNQSFRILLPKHKSRVVQLEYVLLDNRLNYLPLFLSIAGVLTLILRRSYVAAVVLTITYLYFASTIGLTRWQGSRLFFPGQVATLPLIGIALTGLYDVILIAVKKACEASRAVWSGS